jgi:hypothetical protein
MNMIHRLKAMMLAAVLVVPVGTCIAVAAPSYQSTVTSNNSPSSPPSTGSAFAPSTGSALAPSTSPPPPVATTMVPPVGSTNKTTGQVAHGGSGNAHP